MAILTSEGRELLDQTPVSLPLHFDRPEPLHQRIRRMILQATQEADDGQETLEDANDFEIPDDPSSFDTGYTEPDLEPQPSVAFTSEEIAAARAAVEALRKQKSAEKSANAADSDGVSSPSESPAEPPE